MSSCVQVAIPCSFHNIVNVFDDFVHGCNPRMFRAPFQLQSRSASEQSTAYQSHEQPWHRRWQRLRLLFWNVIFVFGSYGGKF